MTEAVEARVARHLLIECGNLAPGERVVIVYDDQTADLGHSFLAEAKARTDRIVSHLIPRAPMHGTEPPASVAASMAEADLVIGLTFMSMAHTKARMDAAKRGARYLSLPEYSTALLKDPSLMVDYRGRAPIVRAMADAFTVGSAARVMTRAGTDIRLDIRNRQGNYCPGFVVGPGDLGSPPDIEANVSPVETESEGVVVIDGSIPCREIGLLRSPVTLYVSAGRITRFDSEDAEVIERLKGLFSAVGSEKAYVLAECGVGLNDRARLTGIMLTDEGALGCMHFGFGSNATVGGANDVPFHLDFCFRSATLEIDGHRLIDQGRVLP